MPQTFYIETDEEIISIIGRLRKSGSQENVFVLPKRALILQSIVNLRLFQREAQKLGKKIIIVTQDDQGRLLAEKAGIETQNYSDDMGQRSTHVELAPGTATGPALPVEASPAAAPRSENIGSSDFYEPLQIRKGEPASLREPQPAAPEPPQPPLGVPLRVRNASPERPPGLNSQRSTESVQPPQPVPQALPPNPGPLPGAFPAPLQPPQYQSQTPRQAEPVTDGNRHERLRNFFGSEKPVPPQTRPLPPQAPLVQKPKPHVSIPGKKMHGILYLLGGVSLLSVLGLAVYLFLPKVDIHVVPHRVTQNIDIQLTGTTGFAGDENSVPVQLAEKQEVITVSANATGSSASNNQKARGSIIISNSFSGDPQGLVATTRFETSDGKVYRLVDSVTVPGMSGSEPGVVEANVIADQAGESYNIDASTFTIPGFKGSPKFEKFSAKSVKKMQGGGNGGSSLALISKTDIEKAEAQAKDEAKKKFLAEYQASLKEGEKILDESIEVTKSGNEALPQVGTAAENFDYTATFTIKAFVLNEGAIREKISAQTKTSLSGMEFVIKETNLSYGEITPNFSENSVRVKTHGTVILESKIDEAALKNAFAGKNEEQIQGVLETYPEIKKLELTFKPDWFATSIPKSTDRIHIIVEKGEE